MLHPIQDGYFEEVERAHAVEASDIYTILGLVGAALMMRVDSTA